MKKMKYQEGGGTPVEVERSSTTDEILGTLSPLYGMVKGTGAFGKNDLGLLPTIARRMRRKEMEDSKSPVSVSIEIEESGMEKPEGMRRGGMTRGGRDGCAIRGKTKGRMV